MGLKYDDYLNSPQGRRWHDIAYWTLLAVACAVFYWMNLLTPLKEDDMLHSMVIGDLTHINSLGDLLHCYRNKFLITNGRSSDMIAELFCGLLGKPLFNVFNTLMFGLLAHVVSLLATRRRSLLAQTMLYACIGTCFPVPGETLLWLAGSCNYLWSITGSLWLLYYLLNHGSSRLGWSKGILLLLGALLAGAGNEAMSFGFVGGVGLYYLVNRKSIDRTVVVGMTGYILGLLLIMASPAAWERAAGGGIAVDMPFMDLLQSRLHILGEKMIRFIVPLAALVIGVITLFWKGVKTLTASVWPYLLVMLMLLLFILGWIPERPYAPLVTVSLIITAIAADWLLRRPQWLRAIAILACLALSVMTFGKGVKVLRDYKVIDEQVVNEIRAATDQAVLHQSPFRQYNRFLYPLPMQSDRFFQNEYIWRAYFDKQNIQFVSDSVYDRFHGGRLLDGAVEMPFTSDKPALTGPIVAFPDQNYMLLTLNLDTLPTAYQVGTAYRSDSDNALSESEKDFRKKHALQTTSDPFGYYPLRVDGKTMMVLPLVDNGISSMELLLDYAGDERLTLFRQAPNPETVQILDK